MLFTAVQRIVLVAMLVAVQATALGSTPVLANADPCGDVQNEPDPPLDDPTPLVSGTVTEAGPSLGISGATLKIYQCDDGEATYVETVYTDQNGDYTSSTLQPEYFYYVEAVLTGPLEGMTPASGTENPSDAVGLGYSVTDLDFEFED